MFRISVFVSGRGSNFKTLYEYLKCLKEQADVFYTVVQEFCLRAIIKGICWLISTFKGEDIDIVCRKFVFQKHLSHFFSKRRVALVNFPIWHKISWYAVNHNISVMFRKISNLKYWE